MKELQNRLNELIADHRVDQAIIEKIRNEPSVVPFVTESRLLAYLLSIGIINYDDYSKLSEEFRIRNQYIELYDMAPRTFGETWGEQHIRNLFPEFLKATRKTMADLYPEFAGEFDLWNDGIRVEVKACRANNTIEKGSLASRTYSHREAQNANFEYHYQQLKPSCCDVFIWIGVCKDELLYWVLSSYELQCTGKLSPQHRNENTGVADVEVFEGQVFMTEEELTPFLVDEGDILIKVLEKGNIRP